MLSIGSEKMVRKYIFLILISVIWGSQFYFAEKVLDEVDPVTLAAIRSIVGAITLTVVAVFIKNSSYLKWKTTAKSRNSYLLYVSIALLEAVIPFFLVAWGQERVSSSIASILIGTTPIWTLLIESRISTETKSLPNGRGNIRIYWRCLCFFAIHGSECIFRWFCRFYSPLDRSDQLCRLFSFNAIFAN